MATPATRDLPLALIDPPTHNARKTFDPERLGELADSIAANGLINPVQVLGPDAAGRYQLVAGERRLRAHHLLHWPTIRADIYPEGTPTRDIAAAENLIREQLNPMEEAEQVRLYVTDGESIAAIARKLRRSRGWVEQRLTLLELPEELREAVATGTLGIAAAVALAAIDYQDYRQELVGEAIRTGATVSIINTWAAHYAADRERIIRNHATVAEILERRADWKYFVRCDGCNHDVEYTTTRGARFCPSCAQAIAAALAQEASSSAQA